MRPSKYAIVGTTAFRHPSGRVVRPVLLATTARVFLADLDTAERLDAGAAGTGAPAASDTGLPVASDTRLPAASDTGLPVASDARLPVASDTAAPAAGDADRDRRLADAGLLVDEGRDEAAEVIAAGREAARDRRTREFVLMPSAYCNMQCGYCGQRHERVTVSADHRSAVVARFDRAARSGQYDKLAVRWFGGEPLMAYAVIRDLSRHFVAAADATGTAYTAKMITNGVLLDERKLRVLHEQCRIGQLEITLDGPAEMHDASRPLKRGGGSFDAVVGVIAAALRVPELAGLQFVIRTNVGVHNAGLADQFAATLAAAGLAHDRVSCYAAPIHSWGNDVTEMAVSRRAMAEVELAWLLAYRRHGLRFPLLPPAPRRVVCTATTRHSEVIAPDGRIYSCTEQPLVPGVNNDHLGHVSEPDAAGPRPAGAFDDWYDTVDAGETACRDCAILPLCGGACPKLWREGKPPCPPLRDNVRQRLDLYALNAGYTPMQSPGAVPAIAPRHGDRPPSSSGP